MTSSFTESQHAGEFIVSEANGELSRESGTVKSGQNLVDGQLVELNTGKLQAKSATVDTDGNFTVPVEGIIIGNWNASSTGTNADIPNVPYIKRLAEVKDELLTYPSGKETLSKSVLQTQLASDGASNIRVR